VLDHHLGGVEQLLGLLDRLVDFGKSVIVIEHHQAVMAHADWIIGIATVVPGTAGDHRHPHAGGRWSRLGWTEQSLTDGLRARVGHRRGGGRPAQEPDAHGQHTHPVQQERDRGVRAEGLEWAARGVQAERPDHLE